MSPLLACAPASSPVCKFQTGGGRNVPPPTCTNPVIPLEPSLTPSFLWSRVSPYHPSGAESHPVIPLEPSLTLPSLWSRVSPCHPSGAESHPAIALEPSLTLPSLWSRSSPCHPSGAESHPVIPLELSLIPSSLWSRVSPRHPSGPEPDPRSTELAGADGSSHGRRTRRAAVTATSRGPRR